ncbi:MAG: FecR family protein [Bacteroidetes bacterium]|nr:FecR family protein [Bacteroidota bacterium]
MTKDRIWTLMGRKLSGEATQAELFELNDLVKQHPELGIPVQYIEEFWSIPSEADEEFLEATFHLHSERMKEQGFDLEIERHETGTLNLEVPAENKKKKRLLWMSTIMVCLIAFFAFSMLFKSKTAVAINHEKVAPSEVSTKNGSRTKIQLPDGSSVWLNSSSQLVYDNDHFGDGNREVSLTGEAFFDVVKNPQKPFIIHTAKMDVKVLGTAFNVKCYPGEKTSETSLIRGSVEVTPKNSTQKYYIKPNEKLIITDDEIKYNKPISNQVKQINADRDELTVSYGHLTLYPKDSSIVETGWVESRLVFSDEKFDDIAKKMERWYGVTIVIANEKLKKELLTGSFEKETIDQALNALQYTTPFNYKINKDIITITK